MTKTRFNLPRGMRDIEYMEMAKRRWVEERIQEVLTRYGFMIVEPSPIEDLATLEAKCGPSIRDEIYWFEDKAGRKQGLRFDLTVGLARMAASHQEWFLPLKLSAYSNMWRYDEPQHARYRCFYQWDAEIFGAANVEADAEIIALSLDIMENLGLKNTRAHISNRKLIEGYLKHLNLENGEPMDAAFRAVDKISKQPADKVLSELIASGLAKKAADELLSFITNKGEASKVLENLPPQVLMDERIKAAVDRLRQLFNILETLGMGRRCLLDSSIVRGISYYDGMVFEVFDEGCRDIGAVVGGGRFDELCAIYGRDIPGVGAAGGIERIMLALEKTNILPSTTQAPTVFVAAVDDSVRDETWRITRKLRNQGIPTDIDLKQRSFTKQLEYANALGVAYTVIVGPRELQKGLVKVKDMKRRVENEVPLDKLETQVTPRSVD